MAEQQLWKVTSSTTNAVAEEREWWFVSKT